MPDVNRELMRASLTLEQAARGVGVDGSTLTARTYRSAIGRGPTDQPERLISLVVRKARAPAAGLAPGGLYSS